LALSLALLPASYSNAQDSVTSNLVNPTEWSNVIYMDNSQLSQVEGTGGGPTPAFNTDTNTIRFSYTPYTVSQIIAINSVLSGQGIRVSGFNYSWKIYNDLENCCSTSGSLSVHGSLTDKSGKVLESYNYDYSLTNTGAAFQTFAGTETFSSPYQLNSLGNISISWTGNDTNFWSGYYGPRVRDTSLTLNYSVNQTTSPTPTATDTGTPSPIEIAEPFSSPLLESEPQQQTAYSSSPSTGSESSNNSTPSLETQTTSNSTPLSAPSEGSRKSSVPTSQILSMIGSQQSKNDSLANSVNAAAQAQAQSAASSATLQAESIALTSATPGDTAGHGSMLGTSNSRNSSLMTGDNGFDASKLNFADTYSTVNDTAAPVSYNLLQNGRQASVDVEISSNQGLKMNSGSPLDSLLNPGLEAPTGSLEQPASSVKKNIQSNELAGRVDIASIATQPTGYQAYSMMMPDVAFYAPKEIYKNQVNVDNARVLRGLGSDRLHQEMVNQQYRLGK